MSLITPNKTMFMRAECTPPSAWTGHIPFAGWLVEATAPAIFVELGTHHGTSYLAFCQAVQANGLPTRCFAVDTWEGDEHAGMYGEEVFAQLAGYHARKYAGFSRLMRMPFDEASTYFEDGSVDILHIDGLHTYDAVRHDFETWLPKLSSRGVILFHDTCVREREFGVWRFWAEISGHYPSFAFKHSHGLGILAVGKEIPSPLQALLSEAGEGERWLVNQMFETLGSVIDAHSETERLTRALAHEQALRRQDSAEVISALGEVVREQIDSVRRDVAHVGNIVSSRAASDGHMEREWRALVESLQDEVRVGVDAVRHDIVSVRDTLVAAGDRAAEEERLLLSAHARAEEAVLTEVSVRSDALQAQISRSVDALQTQVSDTTHLLRSDLVTLRDNMLRSESERMDSMLEAVARLQRSFADLRDKGLTARLRRLVGRGESSAVDQ